MCDSVRLLYLLTYLNNRVTASSPARCPLCAKQLVLRQQVLAVEDDELAIAAERAAHHRQQRVVVHRLPQRPLLPTETLNRQQVLGVDVLAVEDDKLTVAF